MKQLKGKLLKHNRMMDVCFEVLSSFETNTNYKFKGRWINLGFNESFYIFHNSEYIKVNKKSLKEDWLWTWIDHNQSYRNTHWRRIPNVHTSNSNSK